MDKFLREDLLKTNTTNKRKNLNSNIIIKENKSLCKNLTTKKTAHPESFTREFYETFKEQITLSLHKLLQRREKVETNSSHFEAIKTLMPKPKNV